VNTVVPTAARNVRGDVLNRLVSSGAANRAQVSSDNWASILQDRLQASNPGQTVCRGRALLVLTDVIAQIHLVVAFFPTGVIPQSGVVSSRGAASAIYSAGRSHFRRPGHFGIPGSFGAIDKGQRTGRPQHAFRHDFGPTTSWMTST